MTIRIATVVALLAALALSTAARAQNLIPYGQTYKHDFCLYAYAAPNELVTTIAGIEARDIRVFQAGVEADRVNAPVDNGDCFSVTLATTETDTTVVKVLVADDEDAWLPVDWTFTTYGDPLAAHPWIGIPGLDSGLADATNSNPNDVGLDTSFATNQLKHYQLYIVRGPGAGDYRTINASSGDSVTVNRALTTDAGATSAYYVMNADQLLMACDDTTGRCETSTEELAGNSSAAVAAEEFFDDPTVQSSDIITDLATIDGLVSELQNVLVLTDELTADSGTVATLVDAALTEATNNWFSFGAAIVFTSGTLDRQVKCVTSYISSSKTLGFVPPTTTAVSTQNYYLIAAPGCAVLGNP